MYMDFWALIQWVATRIRWWWSDIAYSNDRGAGIKIGKKFAPNAIFRVSSCLYILFDLTCSIWLKNSTHSHSYKAYCCFTVFFTRDWLVTHSSPLMIKPQWCQIPLPSVALCQTACHILLLSHLKCSYKQSVTYKSIILLNTPAGGQIFEKLGYGRTRMMMWCHG